MSHGPWLEVIKMAKKSRNSIFFQQNHRGFYFFLHHIEHHFFCPNVLYDPWPWPMGSHRHDCLDLDSPARGSDVYWSKCYWSGLWSG